MRATKGVREAVPALRTEADAGAAAAADGRTPVTMISAGIELPPRPKAPLQKRSALVATLVPDTSVTTQGMHPNARRLRTSLYRPTGDLRYLGAADARHIL